MITQLLIVNFFALIIYMTIWFLIAKTKNRLDIVDAAWGSGFALVAWISVIQRYSLHSVVLAVLVTMWSARLTRHIGARLQTRHDPRYELIASKWKGNYWVRAFFSIYMLQGVIVWAITIPISLAAGLQVYAGLTSVFAVIGAAIWTGGFIIETISDKQLHDFIAEPNHKGEVMDHGLWRYSRHPNYFGEIVLWYGLAVFALSASYGWAGLIGPTILAMTIIFASGIPPIENRKKSDPKYRSYMNRTSVLIPLPPRSK
jgi:steroid 5-alpha reductase family enzyme